MKLLLSMDIIHTAHISEEKIKFFQQKLLLWFEENARQFRWRDPSLNPYQIIISEILLQRTKAETVSKFYDGFLSTFPDWESLAGAELIAIEEYLRPVGLYRQRASRLQKLAVYMVEKSGVIPTQRNQLEEVSFMGQYIANAVELLIHGINKPLLDVNMARVLERFFGKRKMADIRYDPYLQALSLKIVDNSNSKGINWAILDFSASVCRSSNPRCCDCPIKNCCNYVLNLS